MNARFGLLLCLFVADAVADPPGQAQRVVAAARAQVGVTLRYDGSYRRLAYPDGDVPMDTGVCTDVVVRALRNVGIDLQRAIFADRTAHRARYARTPIDRNIDHRRVPNLRIWFSHHAVSMAPDDPAHVYAAGDIVSWKLPGNLDHIGIVSDRRIGARPLILHNIGRGTREEDVLLAWTITGHYRLR